MWFKDKKINEYIDDLESELNKYCIAVTKNTEKFNTDKVDLKISHLGIKRFDFVSIYTSSNSELPTVVIDDYIPLNHRQNYHLTIRKTLNYVPEKNNIQFLDIKLNVSRLKKELEKLKKQGYKVQIDSDSDDVCMPHLYSVKRKRFLGEAVRVHEKLEKDFIEVHNNVSTKSSILGKL